jgi:hypothetical protein
MKTLRAFEFKQAAEAKMRPSRRVPGRTTSFEQAVSRPMRSSAASVPVTYAAMTHMAQCRACPSRMS